MLGFIILSRSIPLNQDMTFSKLFPLHLVFPPLKWEGVASRVSQSLPSCTTFSPHYPLLWLLVAAPSEWLLSLAEGSSLSWCHVATVRPSKWMLPSSFLADARKQPAWQLPGGLIGGCLILDKLEDCFGCWTNLRLFQELVPNILVLLQLSGMAGSRQLCALCRALTGGPPGSTCPPFPSFLINIHWPGRSSLDTSMSGGSLFLHFWPVLEISCLACWCW